MGFVVRRPAAQIPFAVSAFGSQAARYHLFGRLKRRGEPVVTLPRGFVLVEFTRASVPRKNCLGSSQWVSLALLRLTRGRSRVFSKQFMLMSKIRRQGDIMAVKRMDNVGIVVEDIDAAIEFFTELGLELEGRAPIEGDWADGVTGLRDMRVEIAMMRTPDGHSRLEMSRFLAPPVVADHRNAPVNALGYLRVMFAVEDIDDTLARLEKHGAKVVGKVVQYADIYRLCYIRGPEGILIGLAQELGQQTSR